MTVEWYHVRKFLFVWYYVFNFYLFKLYIKSVLETLKVSQLLVKSFTFAANVMKLFRWLLFKVRISVRNLKPCPLIPKSAYFCIIIFLQVDTLTDHSVMKNSSHEGNSCRKTNKKRKHTPRRDTSTKIVVTFKPMLQSLHTLWIEMS